MRRNDKEKCRGDSPVRERNKLREARQDNPEEFFRGEQRDGGRRELIKRFHGKKI